MKVLFIGGTGTISSACSRLAVSRGFELFILNRGLSKKYETIPGAEIFTADIRKEDGRVSDFLKRHDFDVIVDWVGYIPSDMEQDIKLFFGRTSQFIFISSTSIYKKPVPYYLMTEKTPIGNPFSEYSRNKIACEEILNDEYEKRKFPVTVVRPSFTYGPGTIPLCVNSPTHPYTVIDRMKKGKKVIVPGDGTSLWCMTWNEDFAKGLVGLFGNKRAVGEIFHITSDEITTWDNLFMEAGKAAGVEPQIIHIPSDLLGAHIPRLVGSLIGDKSNSVVFDNSKIRRFVPDFKPETPWSEGIRKSLEWFNADPSRRAIDEKTDKIFDGIISSYLKVFPQDTSNL